MTSIPLQLRLPEPVIRRFRPHRTAVSNRRAHVHLHRSRIEQIRQRFLDLVGRSRGHIHVEKHSVRQHRDLGIAKERCVPERRGVEISDEHESKTAAPVVGSDATPSGGMLVCPRIGPGPLADPKRASLQIDVSARSICKPHWPSQNFNLAFCVFSVGSRYAADTRRASMYPHHGGGHRRSEGVRKLDRSPSFPFAKAVEKRFGRKKISPQLAMGR